MKVEFFLLGIAMLAPLEGRGETQRTTCLREKLYQLTLKDSSIEAIGRRIKKYTPQEVKKRKGNLIWQLKGYGSAPSYFKASAAGEISKGTGVFKDHLGRRYVVELQEYKYKHHFWQSPDEPHSLFKGMRLTHANRIDRYRITNEWGEHTVISAESWSNLASRLKFDEASALDSDDARKTLEAVRSIVKAENALQTTKGQAIRALNPISAETLKATVYPVLGPIKLVRKAIGTDPRELYRVPFELIREDGVTITAVLTAWYLHGKIGIEQTEFDLQTSEFDKDLGEKPYVFVDLLGLDDRLERVPEFDFHLKYAKYPNTHFVSAGNLNSMEAQLEAIREKVGPIGGLIIYDHGSPGSIESLELPNTPNRARKGLFSKGAMIKLNNCLTGNGEKDHRFVESLGRHFLDQGGTVYSSKVSIGSNLYAATLHSSGMVDRESSMALVKVMESALEPTATIQLLLHALATQEGILIDDPVLKTPIPPRSTSR